MTEGVLVENTLVIHPAIRFPLLAMERICSVNVMSDEKSIPRSFNMDVGSIGSPSSLRYEGERM